MYLCFHPLYRTQTAYSDIKYAVAIGPDSDVHQGSTSSVHSSGIDLLSDESTMCLMYMFLYLFLMLILSII